MICVCVCVCWLGLKDFGQCVEKPNLGFMVGFAKKKFFFIYKNKRLE